MVKRLRILLRRSVSPFRDKKGGVLILTFWAIIFLNTLALTISSVVRQKLTFVSNLEDRDRLSFFLEAMSERLVYDFIKNYNGSVSSSNQLSSFSINLSEEDPVVINFYKLVDEESKLNINVIDKEVLKRLFQNIGLEENLAEEISASIVDWRDSDSELSHPLESAEDLYYRSLYFPYEAKDGEFETLDELLLVRGIDKKIFEKISDCFTIYGEGRVNINTASKSVLTALGLAPSLAEKILNYRSGEDGITGTEDDNLFTSTSEITPKLSQKFRLSEKEIVELNNVIDRYLTTDSYNFMVKLEVGLKNKKRTSKIIFVFNQKGNILSWREI